MSNAGLKVGLKEIAEELSTTEAQVKEWLADETLEFPAFRNSDKPNAAWRAYADQLHTWNATVWARHWRTHPERRKQWVQA